MKVSYVRINLYNGKSRLKGFVSVTFNNCFAVHGMKIIEGYKGLFIAMPSTQKNLEGSYLDIAHPIDKETRQIIEQNIITCYKEMLEQKKEKIEVKVLPEDTSFKTEITNVSVKLYKGNSRLRGFVSVVFNDCFVVHSIKIIEGDKGLFIAMPSVKNAKESYSDIAHPIDKETRKMMEKHIQSSYEEALLTEKETTEQEELTE